jgi:hypothetical protein
VRQDKKEEGLGDTNKPGEKAFITNPYAKE